KSAPAAIVIFGPDNFDVRDRRVADPAFAAVQNVMVTIASGARFHTAWIRPVSMLRERKTTDPLARHEPWQPTRLLLRPAERMDCLYRERTLHGRQRAQARVGSFQLLHNEAIRRVAHAGAAVLCQIRSIEAKCAHPRNEMFRKFARTMARNDFGQDFLLHKMPGPVARLALLIREKLFDVVIIQGTHAVPSRSNARQFSGREMRTQRSGSTRLNELQPNDPTI